MSKLILIIVGAAWMAVLLPPLVRAKLNGSPANSVTQFRRQLNSLENAGGMPRNLVRPLAPTGQRRVQQTRMPRGGGLTGALVRPEGTRAHRAPMYRSAVEMQRQRRQNIVVGLFGIVVVSLFLAATTGGNAFFLYTFTVSLLVLIGYCYVLVQMRVKRDNERYLSQFRRR
ncbi:MAG: hypothetical protein RLZZ16_1048 [Actinomycetota bacterium]|jgi:hypothetical protein